MSLSGGNLWCDAYNIPIMSGIKSEMRRYNTVFVDCMRTAVLDLATGAQGNVGALA